MAAVGITKRRDLLAHRGVELRALPFCFLQDGRHLRYADAGPLDNGVELAVGGGLGADQGLEAALKLREGGTLVRNQEL
jgi:hypothetical protein